MRPTSRSPSSSVGRQRGRLGQLQPAQLAVGVAAVREAHDRLLADVAALGERDGALHDARLGRQVRRVEVDAVARQALLDAQRLAHVGPDRDGTRGERRVPGRPGLVGDRQQERSERARVPARARRCERPLEQRALARDDGDVDATTLPAEAGVVERAISFTKGCYVGQEPIVRLAHRGHANRELRRLQLAEAPALPATLLDGDREVGRITSSAGLPEGGAAALGYVRRAVADGAALIALEDRGERVAGPGRW